MQGILGRQIEAERQALERDAMNMRGGVLRQEPSMMQKIVGTVADYAVPDRYSSSSVMEPRLNMEQLESLRGTPVNMADVPNPVPMLMDTMPMAGITAFHGSPHKFSKFDMGRIGTGEGVQSYGHGLYFAENPNVARGYADTGSRNSQFDSGHRYVIRKGNLYDDAFDIEKMHKGAGASGGYESRSSFFDDSFKSKDEALRFLESKGYVPSGSALGVDDVGNYFVDSRKANLYKVDIPDEHIDKMLDWDKSLSEQGEGIVRLADKYGVSHNADGGTLLEVMSANLRSKALASDEIKELGIKGIKYLDQGSRGAGKGTQNFVVFDDQIPQILEINDKPLKGVLSGQ